MRPSRLLVLCLLLGAACSSRSSPSPAPSPTAIPRAPATATPSPMPAPSPSASPSTGASAGPSPSRSAGPVALGPVWPIEPRTVRATGSSRGTGPAVLRAIRTSRHGSYERLVLELTGAFGDARVGYVPVVRADPSDRVVPLRGTSSLQVVLHGAVARYAAAPITPYTGPNRVSPGYPTLAQVAVSGDFEAVLSFGLGLNRTAGFQVTRLRAPDRLVVDVAEPPAWRSWPEDSLTAARAVQAAFVQGHQPWRGDPAQVAALYARRVYAFSSPQVRAVPGTDRYRLGTPGSPDHVTIRVVRPFGTPGVVEVADTR